MQLSGHVMNVLHLMCCDLLQSGLLQSVFFTFLLTYGGITDAFSISDEGGEEQFIDHPALRQRRKTTTKPPSGEEDAPDVDDEIGADSGSWYEYDGPRNETYDPHHGFEMYWPNGEWVLPENYYPQGKITTLNTAENCGRPCAQKFKDYGPVCARNLYGVKAYDFKNYCEFMTQDCDKTKGWQVAYRGKCDRNPIVPKGYTMRNFYGWKEFPGNKADALIYNFLKTSPTPPRTEATTKHIVAEIKD